MRLGSSSEVLIQVPSYLKGKDQRFDVSAIVLLGFFYLFMWSGSCVGTEYCTEIRYTVNRREKHLYVLVSLP